MASDLVERLKSAIRLGEATGSMGRHPTNIYRLADEAAAHIEKLERDLAAVTERVEKAEGEVGRLREALGPFAKAGEELEG